MRITTLIENENLAGRNDLTAEFGLSLLVETGGHSILFDTGSTSAFADNASAIGVDLASIDAVVLSHHHFDHGGGLPHFFEINEQAPFYLRKAPHISRIFSLFGVVKRPIGLDPEVFDHHGDRCVEIDDTTEIFPGVFLLTTVVGEHPRPRGNAHLLVETDTGAELDPFDHELTMVIREETGMVIFTGCSHNGVLNMVDAAVAAFPDTPIDAIIGGFHLIGLPFYNSMAASRSDVEHLAHQLGERCQGPIVTGHCTGKKATRILKNVLGPQLKTFPTGTIFEV